MYLLDSSAWLAHLFGESGVEQVNLLFDDPLAEVNISALSIAEVYARLKAVNAQDQWQEVWNTYAALFTRTIAADAAVAHRAVLLRSTTPQRLPTIDGLIAATAALHDLTLVHRDPHLASIPTHLLRQILLPDK